MVQTPIYTLDLNFQTRRHAIASYLVKHSSGIIMIESGPASTLEAVQMGLRTFGMTYKDVTHVFLTHIHLDHAGAAGWLAQNGAQIFVHPNGAPHMADPERLLASAQRLYGDTMHKLWGDILPVPGNNLNIINDNEEIKIGNLQFSAINTPGHAEHHLAYLFNDVCFTGDVGGVRMPDYRLIRLPLVPPELHLDRWRQSIERLQKYKIKRIAPTHFGIFTDPAWHFQAILRSIDSVSRWLKNVMSTDPTIEELRQKYIEWLEDEYRKSFISGEVLQTYQIAIPDWLSADGLHRYWYKNMAVTH